MKKQTPITSGDLKNKLTTTLAFQELFETEQSNLRRFTYKYVKDKTVAEDLVADVFSILWRKRTLLMQARNPKSYLYCSMRNRILNYTKANRRAQQQTVELSEQHHFLSDATSPESLFLSKELGEQLQQAIDLLPPRCHSIFTAVRLQQMSYKEAAEQLDTSVKNVEVQLRIASIKIRKWMEEYAERVA
jgi:RNA polymerase sigma-70 factor (ECF subfamily)